jgi:WD40 repeat protein
VSYSTQGIRILHDSAYIAINDFGSGSVGKLGVVDLKGQKEKHEVDLGPTGINPYDVEVEPANQQIFTLNDLTYANASVTKYNAPSVSYTNTSLHLSSGCTSSLYYQGNIYFQAGNDNNIGLFNTTTLTVWDSLKIYKYIYGMGMDSADGYIYVGQTDYSTFGNVYIYNLFGHPIDSFAVDVSPGSFAFDIRSTTGVSETKNVSANLNVYPNPTSDEVRVNFTGTYKGTASLVMTDVLGREVYQSNVNTGSPANVSLSALPNGIYFLTLETPSGNTVQKIIKE